MVFTKSSSKLSNPPRIALTVEVLIDLPLKVIETDFTCWSRWIPVKLTSSSDGVILLQSSFSSGAAAPKVILANQQVLPIKICKDFL